MHAMADAAHGIAENPAMGELPGGTHLAAFERHREMMMAMKTMAKHGDHVLGEIARVGGNGDVDHDGAVWDHVKDGAHDDVRSLSSELRHDLRDEANHHVDGARPHPDIRHHARAFADDVRRVADDPDNGYIERARGDDQDHHPQDIHAMADQAEGVTAALDELLTHMNTSAHAHYVKGALQEKPVGLDSRRLGPRRAAPQGRRYGGRRRLIPRDFGPVRRSPTCRPAGVSGPPGEVHRASGPPMTEETEAPQGLPESEPAAALDQNPSDPSPENPAPDPAAAPSAPPEETDADKLRKAPSDEGRPREAHPPAEREDCGLPSA